MARIRTIKPEFWASEQVMSLSLLARLAFIGLWNFCDDGGNHPASVKTFKAKVFPSDDLSAADMQRFVEELMEQALITLYQVGGKAYWHVTGWDRHQRIDKPTFKHPTPPEDATKARLVESKASTGDRREIDESAPNDLRTIGDGSSKVHQTLDEGSSNAQRGGGEASTPEGNGMEWKGNIPPIPPTPDGAVGKSSRPSAVALPTWLALVKAKGEKAIPESDPVFVYAEQAGLPMEFIRLAWREFRARYSEPGEKRYRDWRRVFGKAVRGNWLKLWYAGGDGAYALTTTGMQAQRVDERASA